MRPPPARGRSQRKLLPTIGHSTGAAATADLADRLAAYFGCKSEERVD